MIMKSFYKRCLLSLIFFGLYTFAQPPKISIVSWNMLGLDSMDMATWFADQAIAKGQRLLPNEYAVIKEKRKNRLLGQIQRLQQTDASILCLQEVGPQARDILQRNLPGYTMVAYQQKGKSNGTILFVKKSEFDVVGGRGIGLGDKIPNGPNGEDRGYEGAAAIGLLRSKATGALFVVSSVHVSRANEKTLENTQQGTRQLQTLKNAIAQLEAKHNVTSDDVHRMDAGDFNTGKEEFASNTLDFLSQGQRADQRYTEAFPGADTASTSEKDSDGNSVPSRARIGIDHIVMSPDLKKIDADSKIIGTESGEFIHEQVGSDHGILQVTVKDTKTLVGHVTDLYAKQYKNPNFFRSFVQNKKRDSYLALVKTVPVSVQLLLKDYASNDFNDISIDKLLNDKNINQDLQQAINIVEQKWNWFGLTGKNEILSHLRAIQNKLRQAKSNIERSRTEIDQKRVNVAPHVAIEHEQQEHAEQERVGVEERLTRVA